VDHRVRLESVCAFGRTWVRIPPPPHKKTRQKRVILRPRPDLHRRIAVLQTAALASSPLGPLDILPYFMLLFKL
jgi:hypothetical protein